MELLTLIDLHVVFLHRECLPRLEDELCERGSPSLLCSAVLHHGCAEPILPPDVIVSQCFSLRGSAPLASHFVLTLSITLHSWSAQLSSTFTAQGASQANSGPN